MNTFTALLAKNRHRLPTLALIIGFFVDIITFRTLNLVYAQMLLGVHLFIVAVSTIILALPIRGSTSFTRTVKAWVPVAQQYSLGNLLSAFLILYSASGSLAASWPFFALLAIAIVGNETLHTQKRRLPFTTSLLFLNLLLFSALAFPMVVGSISIATFLVSTVLATIVFQLFRFALRFAAREAFMKNRHAINRSATGVLVLVVALYFTNLIPPIPLSLKHAEFYHRVERAGDTYYVTDEVRSLFEKFFDLFGTELRLVEGADAYVFTAVFAPARIDTDVVHRWERRDDESGQWVSEHVTRFPIVGGRSDGYRGFSATQSPEPGAWRVSVETSRGQVIGRSYLTISRVGNAVPVMRSEVE